MSGWYILGDLLLKHVFQFLYNEHILHLLLEQITRIKYFLSNIYLWNTDLSVKQLFLLSKKK